MAKAKVISIEGRSLITGGDPEQIYDEIPTEEEFKGKTYLESESLRKIGNELIKQRIEALKQLKIRYLWKADGGTSQGCATFARTIKTTGLVRFYSGADVIIWLAADHIKDKNFTRFQLEATLFAQLCEIGKDEKANAITVGPDFQGFYEEIKHYGLWREDLERMGETIGQLKLL